MQNNNLRFIEAPEGLINVNTITSLIIDEVIRDIQYDITAFSTECKCFVIASEQSHEAAMATAKSFIEKCGGNIPLDEGITYPKPKSNPKSPKSPADLKSLLDPKVQAERQKEFDKWLKKSNERIAKMDEAIKEACANAEKVIKARKEAKILEARRQNVKIAQAASVKARHERAEEIKRKEAELMALKAKNGHKMHNGKPLQPASA